MSDIQNPPLSERLMNNILVVITILSAIYVVLSLTILEYNPAKVGVSVFSMLLFGGLWLLARQERLRGIAQLIFALSTSFIMVFCWFNFDGASGGAGYFYVIISVALGVIFSTKHRVFSIGIPMTFVLSLAVVQYNYPELIRYEAAETVFLQCRIQYHSLHCHIEFYCINTQKRVRSRIRKEGTQRARIGRSQCS